MSAVTAWRGILMARPKRTNVIRRKATQARRQATDSPSSVAASLIESKFDPLGTIHLHTIWLTSGLDRFKLRAMMQYCV